MISDTSSTSSPAKSALLYKDITREKSIEGRAFSIVEVPHSQYVTDQNAQPNEHPKMVKTSPQA